MKILIIIAIILAVIAIVWLLNHIVDSVYISLAIYCIPVIGWIYLAYRLVRKLRGKDY